MSVQSPASPPTEKRPPPARPAGRRAPLCVDLTIGGNGDNWMRLAGLYTAAALRPERPIVCVLPKMLRSLAPAAFGDRLQFLDRPNAKTLAYTNRGLKDLLRPALSGKRFLVPYHRVMIQDWDLNSAKDKFNIAAFSLFDRLDWMQLPPWPALNVYQGYLEVVTIRALRDITWEEFLGQARGDYDLLFQNLAGDLPLSPELSLPPDIGVRVAVFPSGTGHQFMPVGWAARNLPDAVYCFFERDKEQERFADAGLRVLHFHREPGDIIEIARRASWAITTDSFASHMLQYSTERVVLALAEFPRARVVSPFFRGVIVDSAAPCSPCPHLERGHFPACKAGLKKCLTWQQPAYTQKIVATVASK